MIKNKNYYKKEVERSYSDACSSLKDILKKYGAKGHTRGTRTILIPGVTNERNGRIEGFYLGPKKISVVIYWQGDHTDGTDYIDFNSSGILLKSQLEDSPRGTRMRHEDVRFDQDQLWKAIKQAINEPK